jgi:DNA (cytosine-5)-methyltransferase 1
MAGEARAKDDEGQYRLPIKCFDFFSGCGGTCKGFEQAGIDIVFATDINVDAGRTFQKNFPNTHFLLKDITFINEESIQPLIDACEGHPLLFSGCAPCQPFTKQNTQKPDNDGRRTLLGEFQRFVEYYRPEFVFIENVPGLQKVKGEDGPLNKFNKKLKEMGYSIESKVIASYDYGVPQQRRRFVLLASRLGKMDFCPKTHGIGTDNPDYSTVREWIGNLPPISAGEMHPTIPNHRAAALSSLNLERIRAISEGGDRRDWPEHLRLNCHTGSYKGHTDVYGRMRWGSPASGLTTRCISLSNGRFGHPEQDRAISVREAACLQTFPLDFEFTGSLNSMARQIGNAVPVRLAECFCHHFMKTMNAYLEGNK